LRASLRRAWRETVRPIEISFSERPTAGVGDGSFDQVVTAESEFERVLRDRLLRRRVA